VVEQEYDLVAQRLSYLREQAQRNGNLQSDEYVKVIEKETKIYIESAQPEIIYLPTYNPVLVYGSWWHSYQPRLWHYNYLTRYPQRYNNYGLHVGVHISTGNIAISWNPFRYVRHNYWRDRYDIKTRHQIFSRRLQTSHYSHNVHRQENWGQNHIKVNNIQQQQTKQRPKIKDRSASSQFTKRVPIKQSATRSNQAINQNTNRATNRPTNRTSNRTSSQPVKSPVQQTYSEPVKQAPKQPTRVKNRNVVSQSTRQPVRGSSRQETSQSSGQPSQQETRQAPKRPTVEKNVNKPSYVKQR